MRIYTRRVATYLLCGVFIVVIINVVQQRLTATTGERELNPRHDPPMLRNVGGESELHYDPLHQRHVPIEKRIAKYRLDYQNGSNDGMIEDHFSIALLGGRSSASDLFKTMIANKRLNTVRAEKSTSSVQSTEDRFMEFIEQPSDTYDAQSRIIWRRFHRVSVSQQHSSSVWMDRILPQMSFVPKSYSDYNSVHVRPLKTIYVPSGVSAETPLGQKMFMDEECPVNACNITSDELYESTADLRLLQGDTSFQDVRHQNKPPGQIWVLWLLESAENTQPFEHSENKINWTATYRWDSTIVTPYGKFVPYSEMPGNDKEGKTRTSPGDVGRMRNYAAGKTKMVAWFVSNCGARNKRLEFAKELGEYVSVDIYGACGRGNIHCERGDSNCTASLNQDYKFYLSFENSNCHYYITEKLFENGLSNDVVPIVMGSRKEDYFHAAPPHSYIHVEDFRSAKELAHYLAYLDKNDEEYNEYFRWKTTGTFINTKFWCRLCALLHDDSKPLVWYSNFVDWWNVKEETCTSDRWEPVLGNST